MYGLAIDAVEGNVCGIRQPRQRIAGDEGLGNALKKPLLQPVAEQLYPCGFVVHAL